VGQAAVSHFDAKRRRCEASKKSPDAKLLRSYLEAGIIALDYLDDATRIPSFVPFRSSETNRLLCFPCVD
jgi:hypothetical protein